MSITGMIFKASCKRSDDKRDAGLSTPSYTVRTGAGTCWTSTVPAARAVSCP